MSGGSGAGPYNGPAVTRRLAPLLCLLLALPPVLPAQGQETGEVELSLVRQIAWSSPDRPLTLSVRAVNGAGRGLRALSIAITVFDRVTSRTAYKVSLASDVTAPLETGVSPLRGALRPGATRTFAVEKDIGEILRAAGRHTTGVFPVLVELRSEGIPVALLRTPAVYLTEPVVDNSRLNVAWSFVLHEPIGYGPDGTFLTPSLERAIAKGASLESEVSSLIRMLEGPNRAPATVVLSPPLLTQLEAMRDGYSVMVGPDIEEVPEGEAGAADAARLLDQIGAIARHPLVEGAALPLAAPSVPALIRANIAGHLRQQLDRGTEEVERLTGADVSPRVYYPPGSTVDQPSLARLAGRGTRLVLLATDQVALPVQDRGFAPPPTVRIGLGGSRALSAVVPDAGIEELLSSSLVQEDPRLGVQTVLGELATVWLEQPGEVRGVAISFSDRLALPARLFRPLIDGISRAPWLRPVTASGVVSRVPPDEEPLELIPSFVQAFPPGYVTRIREARLAIQALRSILVGESPLPARLETMMLLAEAGEFIDLQQVGTSFLDHIEQQVAGTFEGIRPDTSGVRTLASRAGIIQVDVANETGQAVRVTVRLSSPRLRFVEGSVQEVELSGPRQTLFFQVQAQTAGQFPVQVRLETPTGILLSEGELVVRSTAYSRVALIITVGAALFLVARWGRRFLPSRAAP